MAELLDRPLILASSSPRRAELLTAMGLSFQVQPVDIDESALVSASGADIASSVQRIAMAKFHAAGTSDPRERSWLLTADTLVACDHTTLGKPDDDQHLAAMLAAMSGRVLTIVTAVCLGIHGSTPDPQVVTTLVELRSLSASEIDRYVATGVGRDKAAGLALQSGAKPFISSVRGCWSNVVGLPLCAVAAGLGLDPAERTQSDRCSIQLCGSNDS